MKKFIFILLSTLLFLQLAGIFAQPQVTVSGGFVRIQGGTFTMGSPRNEPWRVYNEGPRLHPIGQLLLLRLSRCAFLSSVERAHAN